MRTQSRAASTRPGRPSAVGGVPGSHKPDFWWFIPFGDVAGLTAAFVVTGQWTLIAGAHALITYVALASAGTQQPRLDPRVAQDLPRLLCALAVPVLILGPISVLGGDTTYMTEWVPVSTAFVLIARTVTYGLTRRARSRGEIGDATVIVGCGAQGERLADTLIEHPELGMRPEGFLDHAPPLTSSLPLLGEPADLEDVLRSGGIQRVIVAFGAIDEEDMVAVLRACDGLPVEVHVLPRLFELGVADGPDIDDVWGVPIIRLRRLAFRTLGWRMKRATDIVLAGVGLVAMSPVLLAIAAAIWLTDRGPILFKQERIGAGGQPIRVLKFRTMRPDSDSATAWTVGSDPRCTRIGAILRTTSLDELPQLWNVLRGDMSLVGPRPEREHFAHRFLVSIPRYGDRHRVPVGMTGWAQVHGLRGDTSIPERAEFDNRYVEGWSWWNDIVILWRTVGAVLKGEGG